MATAAPPAEGVDSENALNPIGNFAEVLHFAHFRILVDRQMPPRRAWITESQACAWVTQFYGTSGGLLSFGP